MSGNSFVRVAKTGNRIVAFILVRCVQVIAPSGVPESIERDTRVRFLVVDGTRGTFGSVAEVVGGILPFEVARGVEVVVDVGPIYSVETGSDWPRTTSLQ